MYDKSLLFTPEGVRDIYGEDCQKRDAIQQKIHATMKLYGFKNIQTPTYICKPDDIISVRGHGRFHFISISGETNKGRLKIKYQLYKS